MADINGCIKKLNLSADDAEEIRRMARVAGDPAAGVKQYKDTLKTDLESLRTSLSDKGYDFSVRKPTEELGAKSTPEASMADLGYDVQNVANVTTENVNLARALADTVPGLSAGKDLFKWMGTNSERLLNFKAKYFKFADEKEFEINARVAQETFPELFDAARRGVVSDAQTAKEAKALGKGLTPEQGVQTVLNTPAGYAPNAAEVQFGKMVMGSVHDDLRRIAKIDVSKMSDAESDEISRQYSEALDTWVAVTAKVGGMTSEQGRAFRSLQIAPNDISKVAQKSIKFVDAITGNSRTAEERKALLHDLGKAISMLDPENQQQLDLFVANLHQNKSDLSSKFYEVYYNWGLLSNPSTQFINTLGNTANFILENTERLAAAATMPSEMKPTLFRMAGYGNSLWDAVKVGWRAYKTELPSDPQTVLENMDKRAFPSIRITKDGIKSAGVGEEGIVLGGKQVRIPGRILMGVDDGMKLLHNRAYIYEQMYRRADAQNLTGQARKDFYANFLKDTPSDVLEGAVEEARRLTYTDKLGQGLRGFQQFVDAVPGGRIVIPFVRTPAKIIKQAADMLSVPFISEKLSTQRTADDFAAGGFAQRKAMARVTMGYSLMGLGAYMAANGLATGPAPSDAGERETFNLNKLAWGAKVGNNWIQYNRFDPVAIPITFGVGLEKTFEAFAASGTGLAREEGYLSTMAAFMSDALLDKSFFQGVENVVGAIMEPERRFESFTKGVVRSFTPAITAGYARSVDPRTTAPLTFMEVIQDRIGFEQRKKVPTKVDAFGRDVWNEVPGSYKGDTGAGSVTNRFINPFKAKSGANDPVANELFDLGIKVTPTRKKYKDVDLDSEQVYVLNKAAGKMFYDFTRNAMAQPEWKSKSNVVKRLTIEAFKDASNKYGQAMLLGVYPELASRGALENKDIKKLTAPTRSETNQYILGGKKALDEASGTLKQESVAPEPRKSISDVFDKDIKYVKSSVDGSPALRTKAIPASTVLKHIQALPSDSRAGKLATRLIDVMGVQPEVGVSLVKPRNAGVFNVRGTTDLATAQIDLFVPGDGFKELKLQNGEVLSRERMDGRNEETALHESVHAVVVNGVNASGEKVEQFAPGLSTLYKEFKKPGQYGAEWEARSKKDHPAHDVVGKLDNLHEFVSYAMSNKELQNLMKDTPYRGAYMTKTQRIYENSKAISKVERELTGSVWDKFVGAVADTLGIGDNPPEVSYLDAVMDAGNAMFDKAKYRVDYRKKK